MAAFARLHPLRGGVSGTLRAAAKRLVLVGCQAGVRPVVLGASVRYLGTCACQGGLPLHFVSSPHSNVRRFLRALLREYRTFRRVVDDGYTLAEPLRSYLPRSLRQEPVYRLCAEVMDQIWELRGVGSQQDDPVAVLDRQTPEWRSRMPIDLGDAQARKLIRLAAARRGHGGKHDGGRVPGAPPYHRHCRGPTVRRAARTATHVRGRNGEAGRYRARGTARSVPTARRREPAQLPGGDPRRDDPGPAAGAPAERSGQLLREPRAGAQRHAPRPGTGEDRRHQLPRVPAARDAAAVEGVPVADNIPGGEMPKFRNLWEHIRSKMPKRAAARRAGSIPGGEMPKFRNLWEHIRSKMPKRAAARRAGSRRRRDAGAELAGPL